VKSQSNLITKKLTALRPVHKVLLTGTPLNNTVRELLNLMYFLDPEEWDNLDELERHYENMTESLARELREKIAPYMLRRRKEDVLDLPSKVGSQASLGHSICQNANYNVYQKNEVIVPLTMRPLQRNVYKSILEKNADLMQALAQATAKGGPPLKMKACHNILMQLRKLVETAPAQR
jgi:chromodomain-helicase-DNA-binding protein 4